MIRRILKLLLILQVHNNTKENMKGRGYKQAFRLNPLKPFNLFIHTFGGYSCSASFWSNRIY